MDATAQHNNEVETSQNGSITADYAQVTNPARIACYDDLKAAPRVIVIEPAPTYEFIEKLASTVYEQSRMLGGKIAYTAIREVSENFIHARFEEVIVSILDDGNTIRFADQGPGIPHKEKALLPGFSSAIEPMKHYIRGVGSGFPITNEYIESSHGTITIEDNLKSGAVVTLSLVPQKPERKAPQIAAEPKPKTSMNALTPPLNDRERQILPFFLEEDALGVTDIVNLTGLPQSSTHVALRKLEEAGLIEKTAGKKRTLTEFGVEVASTLV